MAKDYAKRPFITSRRPRNRWRMALLVIPVALIVCGIGFWVYKHKAYSEMAESFFFSKAKTLVNHHSEPKKELIEKPKALAKAPESEIHFDFYNELPKMQVVVPDEENVAVAKPVQPETKSVQYIIQLGSFSDEQSASEMRISLLLNGLESNIVKIDSDKGKVFRVQQGPFVTMAEANKIQRKLQKKGITASVEHD